MELELKRPEKVRIKLDGVVYELSKIKVGEAVGMSEAVKDDPKAVIAFMVGKGMPEDVVAGLEAELLEQILEALHPKKKN